MTYDLISTRKIRKTVEIKTPEDIYKVLDRYTGLKQEHFLLITLNGNHEIISVSIVTIGLANRTIIHPRELITKAYLDNATAIVVAHNHPSGCTKPSDEDVAMTGDIKRACEVMGLHLIDSLIISKRGFYSFRRERFL